MKMCERRENGETILDDTNISDKGKGNDNHKNRRDGEDQAEAKDRYIFESMLYTPLNLSYKTLYNKIKDKRLLWKLTLFDVP